MVTATINDAIDRNEMVITIKYEANVRGHLILSYLNYSYIARFIAIVNHEAWCSCDLDVVTEKPSEE